MRARGTAAPSAKGMGLFPRPVPMPLAPVLSLNPQRPCVGLRALLRFGPGQADTRPPSPGGKIKNPQVEQGHLS